MTTKNIKPVMSAPEAVKLIRDGTSVMVGGFNYGGVPYTLVDALAGSGTKDIELIANDTLYEGVGHGQLVQNGQVRKVIASHVGLNKATQRLYNEGKLELELVPQGTFVERIRCGGFGLGGFLTPTGVGTVHERKTGHGSAGKEIYPGASPDRKGSPYKGLQGRPFWKPFLLWNEQELQSCNGNCRGYSNSRSGCHSGVWGDRSQ